MDKNVSVRAIAQTLKISWSTAKRLQNQDARRRKCAKRKLARVAKRQKLVKTLARKRRVRADGKLQPVHCSSASIRDALKRDAGINVSKRTVVRDLRELGGHCAVRMSVPSLDEAVFQKRMGLGRQWKDKSDDELKKIIFVDESKVSFNDHGQRTMWLFNGDKILPRERKRRDECVNSFQVFCAIGHNFRFITCLRPPPTQAFPRGRPKKGESRPPKQKKVVRLNGAGYLARCVKPIRRALRGKYLFHDGARPHVCSMVKTWLAENNMKVIQNAPYSPMMNAVENVFPLLHKEITLRDPMTLDALEAAVHEGFEAIPQSKINKLVSSFKRRCVEAVKSKGKFF